MERKRTQRSPSSSNSSSSDSRRSRSSSSSSSNCGQTKLTKKDLLMLKSMEGFFTKLGDKLVNKLVGHLGKGKTSERQRKPKGASKMSKAQPSSDDEEMEDDSSTKSPSKDGRKIKKRESCKDEKVSSKNKQKEDDDDEEGGGGPGVGGSNPAPRGARTVSSGERNREGSGSRSSRAEDKTAPSTSGQSASDRPVGDDDDSTDDLIEHMYAPRTVGQMRQKVEQVLASYNPRDIRIDHIISDIKDDTGIDLSAQITTVAKFVSRAYEQLVNDRKRRLIRPGQDPAAPKKPFSREFYKRPPVIADMREGDEDFPNWPRNPMPRHTLAKLDPDGGLSLSICDRVVHDYALYLFLYCGQCLNGYPLYQTVCGGVRDKLTYITDKASRDSAAVSILAQAKDLPFCTLDSESRIYSKFELDRMPVPERKARESRLTYVTLATGDGSVYIYCMAGFTSVREALGPDLLDLLAGKNQSVPQFYVAGVAVFGDEDSLKINFAYGVDLRGLFVDMVEKKYFKIDLAGKSGLKAMTMGMFGESHFLVYPNAPNLKAKRLKFLQLYRTDIGSRSSQIPRARNMLSVFRMDGTKKGLTMFQKVYLVMDVLSPLAIIYLDVLRCLQEGRGKGLSMSAHIARVMYYCRRVYTPPKDLSFRDKYYLDFFGKQAVDMAYYRSMTRYEARRRERGRMERSGQTQAATSAPAISPELRDDGSGIRLKPAVEEYVGEERRAVMEEAAKILEKETDRQWFLPMEMSKRVMEMRKNSHQEEPPASVRKLWKAGSVSLPADPKKRKLILARVAKYSRPHIGQSLKLEEGKCTRCGRHRDTTPCEAGGACRYPICQSKDHDIGLCPLLHGTCVDCGFKGHSRGFECQEKEVLQTLVRTFLEFADEGKWTRYRNVRPVNGALSFHIGHVRKEYKNNDEQLWRDAWSVREEARKIPDYIPENLVSGARNSSTLCPIRMVKDGQVSRIKVKETGRARRTRREAFFRKLITSKNDERLRLKLEAKKEEMDVATLAKNLKSKKKRMRDLRRYYKTKKVIEFKGLWNGPNVIEKDQDSGLPVTAVFVEGGGTVPYSTTFDSAMPPAEIDPLVKASQHDKDEKENLEEMDWDAYMETQPKPTPFVMKFTGDRRKMNLDENGNLDSNQGSEEDSDQEMPIRIHDKQTEREIAMMEGFPK